MVKNKNRLIAGVSYCVYVPGVACGDAFPDKYCRRYYAILLFNALRPYQNCLHAYAILDNSACLLLTPQACGAVHGMLDALNKTYTTYYQSRFERDSLPLSRNIRYCSVVGSELIMPCQKLIERLPMDADLTDKPGAWEWSSYGVNAFGCRSHFLTRHKSFTRYLRKMPARLSDYREFIATPLEQTTRDYLMLKIEKGEAINKKHVGVNRPTITRSKVNKPYSGEYAAVI